MRRSVLPRARGVVSLCAVLMATTFLIAPAALAQDNGQLEEVIVTATKQGATNLQDTPLAVTAYGGDEMNERGVSNINGLVGLAPGLQISDLSGYSQVYIRGVGSNIVFIGSDPSSTVQLDGVYLARPLSYFSDFLDVERVEVLRGPQGTLYGRNAVGGTINIISRAPSNELEGEVRATVGNFGKYGLSGYLSGPLTDGIRGSVAVTRQVHDGYLDNVSTGNDLEDEDFWGARGQLAIDFGADNDLTLRADYSNSDSALGQYPKLLLPTGIPLEDSILGDFSKITANRNNNTLLRNSGVSAEFNHRFSDSLSFKSLSSYRHFSGDIDTDADSSSIDVLRTFIGPIRQNQYSQEFNLIGNTERFDWVLGAYYFHEDNREPLTLAIFPAGASHIQRPDLKATSYAVFGQGEYHFTPALSLVLGARWTHESKDYRLLDYFTNSVTGDVAADAAAPRNPPGFGPQFNIDVSQDDSAVTPKIGLNYRMDHALLYVSATRGFKSGGFDFGATSAASAAAGYGPEFLWAYEVGAKTDWFDNRLRANLSAFFYDYKDLQVQSFAGFGALTQNAADADVKGVELELTARPTSALDLFANFAWLDATYNHYEGAFTNTLGTFNADGNTLNNAPKWAITAGGRYTWDLGNYGQVYAGADAHYQSRVFFTAANGGPTGNYAQQQAAYTVANARLGWVSPSGVWEATLIGSNLNDEEYIVGTADYPLTIAGRPGAPRTVQLQVSRKF